MTTTRLRDMLCSTKNYIQVRNGILSFSDEDGFKKVITVLHAAIDELPQQWNLNIEKADYVMEQFEMLYNFKSLRQYIAMKVNGLMITNTLTADNDPDEYFFPDKVMRGLVNTNFQINIGGKLICIKKAQEDYLRLRRGEKVLDGYIEEQLIRDNGTIITSTDLSSDRGDRAVDAYGITIESISSNPNDTNPLRIAFTANVKVDPDCDKGGLIIYKWTIYTSNGTLYGTPIDQGPTLNYTFFSEGKYKICVEASNNSCFAKPYCIDIEVKKTTVNNSLCCVPYGSKEIKWTYRNKHQMRVRLLVMTVVPGLYSSITAGTRTWKKGALGLVWWANKVQFVSVRLTGKYNELWCKGPERVIPPGKVDSGNNRIQATVLQYSFVPVYVNYQNIKSDHRIKDSNVPYSLALDICRP